MVTNEVWYSDYYPVGKIAEKAVRSVFLTI